MLREALCLRAQPSACVGYVAVILLHLQKKAQQATELNPDLVSFTDGSVLAGNPYAEAVAEEADYTVRGEGG